MIPISELLYYLTFIGKGILITLELLAGGFTIGLMLGILISVLRYQKKGVLIIENLISILRGNPLILQLSLMHFVLPTGILTFGLNSAAYVSEILRSGIESLPKGQFEAAETLHIPTYYMWKDIILPQVIINVLPSLINEIIALLKETAIITVIGGLDIMRQSELLASEKCTYFMPLCIAGVYYYLLVLLIEWIGRVISRRGFYANH